ncbi:unnamed protein product [Camellia sinensis]
MIDLHLGMFSEFPSFSSYYTWVGQLLTTCAESQEKKVVAENKSKTFVRSCRENERRSIVGGYGKLRLIWNSMNY